MKQSVQRWHGVLSTLIMFCGLFALVYAYITRPTIEDVLHVDNFEVVSLITPIIEEDETAEHTGCIIGGRERTVIRPGDPLYVKSDMIFLQKNKERYRTWIRNLTDSRNLYDDKTWSATFSIPVGADYCPYQPLEWWTGRSVPHMRPSVYQLFTEYYFELEGGRIVQDTIASNPFTIVRKGP